MADRTYIAIDLKSFYASAECVARGLDPLNTNLVVADESKTEKTICLAVTPPLKAVGVPGRPRLFEVVQRVRQVNRQRQAQAPHHCFTGTSCLADELAQNPALGLDYIVAPPQMAKYMQVSTQIYRIYLRYIAPEDIHVYSIDEVFIDATSYLKTYNQSARGLAMTLIREVLRETGITATVGIGTNLYLCKVAMDIVAKKMPADSDGVRIAELNERQYRLQLWEHTPLTDFWRVGGGTARRLAAQGIRTMGDLAACSVHDEELLYRMFGVNAELLIDHAWGCEPCTIADIKAYRPETHSLSSGQVLSEPYNYEKTRLIVQEMTELLVLDLVDKCVVTDHMTLSVGYDVTGIPANYRGAMVRDHYGRRMPKPAHGSIPLEHHTSSTKEILAAVLRLYERIADPALLVRRLCIAADHVLPADSIPAQIVQLDLFTEPGAMQKETERRCREHALQRTVLDLKHRYGKNAVLKGMNFLEGATTIQRNGQVGGHRA